MPEITREHLELAALAAGHTIVYWTDAGKPVVNEQNGVRGRFLWCPHLDDGDTARLAVRLQIDAAFGHHITHKVYASRSTAFPSCPVSAAHDGTEPDKLRAWREAVVLCAAAVGAKMKGGA